MGDWIYLIPNVKRLSPAHKAGRELTYFPKRGEVSQTDWRIIDLDTPFLHPVKTEPWSAVYRTQSVGLVGVKSSGVTGQDGPKQTRGLCG